MGVGNNILEFNKELPKEVSLVAVSKTKPNEMILDAYNAGHRIFGENKIQDLVAKYEALPKDIEWHMIGHLQTNKVKYITPFVSLIHGVDSLKLLKEINKRAKNSERVQNILLQIHIAQEETKFGLSYDEARELLKVSNTSEFNNVQVKGFMGMATNTNDSEAIKKEFKGLNEFYLESKLEYPEIDTLSMGMSGDYKLAIACGSNMIRIGSTLFGARNY
ncbi:MAG: YggS family pyridoxal phosphate-dependent enzyme [Crocinitomicaceae bacterium]|nr:YggS family pyridoxal phosphate-dependent enzyme [Crocinitomicaceae bacterium]|tara:strand:- start:12011 stop:12667 length:657 start_codon:yes stop_codon:yes gene_type:complete